VAIRDDKLIPVRAAALSSVTYVTGTHLLRRGSGQGRTSGEFIRGEGVTDVSGMN